jgi:hypothetical protein
VIFAYNYLTCLLCSEKLKKPTCVFLGEAEVSIVIYILKEFKRMKKTMTKAAGAKMALVKTMVVAIFAVASQPASAMNIEFRYDFDTNNFFDTQAKKDVLSAAGSYFSNLITDDLTAITSSGGNHFNVNFFNPADISALSIEINDFSVAADTLVVYAGGSALGGSLGIGGPGGFGASGTGAFLNGLDRGEAGVSSDTDFAPWGGSITFNTASNWYFDADVSTDADVVNNDFYSVALHELGHLLGLGTANSWSSMISNGEFTGAESMSVFGGAVPLSGSGHWADGTLSLVDGVSQEAAMDPSILFGTRKVFTDLDVAGLKDVGWEVSAVPVPAAVWLFGSGLLGLVAVARRRV